MNNLKKKSEKQSRNKNVPFKFLQKNQKKLLQVELTSSVRVVRKKTVKVCNFPLNHCECKFWAKIIDIKFLMFKTFSDIKNS